jgi:hypothetical protein
MQLPEEAAQPAKQHLWLGGFNVLLLPGVVVSRITNYTGNVTNPPLEAPFQAHVWAA